MSGFSKVVVLSNGKPLDSKYEVLSVDVYKLANKIPSARIKISDGDYASREFAASNSKIFELGKEFEIVVSDTSDSKSQASIFKGVLVKHSIKADRCGSYLTIDLKDKAVQLTTARKSAVYLKKTDRKIIKEILGRTTVSVGKIADTGVEHEQMIQYNVTDWDFILSRAEANGLWVIAEAGQVSLVKPNTSGLAQVTYQFGQSSIHELEFEADIRQQLSSITASSWDVIKQQTGKPAKASEFSLAQDTKNAEAAAKKLNTATHELGSYTDLEPAELKAWADAKMQKNRLSLFRGRLTVPGNGQLQIGNILKIQGTSDYFNGKQLITAIRHQITSNRGWETSIQFGDSPQWCYEKYTMPHAAAGGLLPSISGLQIGVVKPFKADQKNKFRIPVTIPAYGKPDAVIFARIGMPYATKEAGWFFIPEPGDEVVIGFFNDDPRSPVILGSMYNPKNKPPLALTADNKQKAIVLKKDEAQLLFDVKEHTLQLATSKETGLSIKDGENLTVQVKQESIAINKGIKANTQQDLVLNAKNINQKASATIQIKASRSLNVQGTKVNIKGSQVDIS